MILGVVLAGGQSTRFGSDKALAELNGHTLLNHAYDALTGFCELVVVAGRAQGPGHCIPDWPHDNMGPLGGIAAALRYARDETYESVLTCGVDSVQLPENLLELLSPAPAYVDSQPVIGHWPVGAVDAIETLLLADTKHSMLAFAGAVGATAVKIAAKPANINTPADLAAMERRDGI